MVSNLDDANLLIGVVSNLDDANQEIGVPGDQLAGFLTLLSLYLARLEGYVIHTDDEDRFRMMPEIRLTRLHPAPDSRGRLSRTIMLLLALLALSTPAGGGRMKRASEPPRLTASEVEELIMAAANAAIEPVVVAVTDRAGAILGILRVASAPDRAIGNFGAIVDTAELAVSLARTGAFFSNDQAPLSSRTVRFISGIHFPPGIRNTANGALYGIENTNRGCDLVDGVTVRYLPGQEVPVSRSIDGTTPGLGITTGKADVADSDHASVNGGGMPIYKAGRVAGGIGVAGASGGRNELASFTAACPGIGALLPLPAPGVIFLEGIRLPLTRIGGVIIPPVPDAFRCPGTAGVEVSGSWMVSPRHGGTAPEGWLVGPSGSPEISAAEVSGIIQHAIDEADRTRAAIRLPEGSRTRMVIAVGDLAGNVLGLYRMPDSTVFSIDVAVSKARNVVFLSGSERTAADLPGVPMGTAMTNRSIGFGSQPLFPPGIGPGSGSNDRQFWGPFFASLYLPDTATPCSQGSQQSGQGRNRSGIVFFPGSAPLYRNGRLVGGLGISGDGVEQDDVVTAAGTRGFEAPVEIRADRILINGVRLPYLKFNRNPGG
ncbi:MAG: heme-binding protein [Acidobacteria bacterium]|nr:heme-binding protein [Acidobacteriota bacterium]